MASMRRLNRRLTRWHRYAHKTYWNPRVSRPAWMGPNTAMSPGHIDAWNARELERERRQCHTLYRPWPTGACYDCGLVDAYDGRGDGIGSCDCPRCPDCRAAPGDCDGHDDEDWDWGDFDDETVMHIIDEHGFAERGLL